MSRLVHLVLMVMLTFAVCGPAIDVVDDSLDNETGLVTLTPDGYASDAHTVKARARRIQLPSSVGGAPIPQSVALVTIASISATPFLQSVLRI